MRRRVLFHDHVAARDVDVVLQRQGDGEGRKGFLQFPLAMVQALDARGEAARINQHFVARLENAAGHAPGIPAEIVPRLALRTDHPLHGKPRLHVVLARADIDVLQMIQQGRALIPWHAVGFLHDVIAMLGRQGNSGDIDDVVQPRSEGAEIRHDALVNLLAEIHEIHLVDRQHEVLDAQQIGQKGVAAGLLQHALPRVHQQDGQLRRGRPGHHVTRVLQMPRRVRDDEFPQRRREIPVGDIDGDALLALGFQSIGQQRQIDLRMTPPLARRFHGVQLVFEDGF